MDKWIVNSQWFLLSKLLISNTLIGRLEVIVPKSQKYLSVKMFDEWVQYHRGESFSSDNSSPLHDILEEMTCPLYTNGHTQSLS
jgi:hypothetical protein